MKKKLFAAVLIFVLALIALSATAFAAQKTYLPVTIVDRAGDKTQINHFQVTNVENLPGRYMNRIHYTLSASRLTGDNAYMDIRCYDATGKLITTINFRNMYVSNSPIDVPDTTATIELKGWESSSGDTYLYKKNVTVYASDGRSMAITDLQLPVYELVGWSRQRTSQGGYSTDVVSGEQKTYLPVIIADAYGDKTQINSFQVTGVQNIPGRYVNRIYYTLSASRLTGDNAYMDVKCYDASGNLITTINFTDKYVSNSPIDVPDTTATIELKGGYGSTNGDSFLYRKTVMVMSNDGRSMDITDLQLPVYRYVGWDIPVYMFSLEGRCIAVPASQVEAHRQVGWYTYDGYYGALCWYCDDLINKGAYEGMFRAIENGLAFLAGTEYEESLYAYRTRGMDAWRSAVNAPVVGAEYTAHQDGSISLKFRNISYKDIRRIYATISCYYANGTYKGERNIAVNDAYLLSAELGEYTWTQSYYSNVSRIDNIRVTEVEFTDGTVWTAG